MSSIASSSTKMASTASVNQFPRKLLLQSSKSIPNTAFPPVNRLNFPALSTKLNRNFSVRAVVSDDEWGEEKEPEAPAVAVKAEEKPSEIYSLKKKLVGTFYGTNRGLNAATETRAEIVELISQLEAKNPTPAPTEALPLLNGKWILL